MYDLWPKCNTKSKNSINIESFVNCCTYATWCGFHRIYKKSFFYDKLKVQFCYIRWTLFHRFFNFLDLHCVYTNLFVLLLIVNWVSLYKYWILSNIEYCQKIKNNISVHSLNYGKMIFKKNNNFCNWSFLSMLRLIFKIYLLC